MENMTMGKRIFTKQ